MTNLDKKMLAFYKEGHLTEEDILDYFRFRFRDRTPISWWQVFPFEPYKVTYGDDTDLSITSTPSEWLIGNTQ